MSIGDRLFEERRRLNLNQSEIARIANVAYGTYANYEKGSRYPDAACLQRLMAGGVDVMYLLTGSRSGSALSGTETIMLELFNRADDRTRHAFLTMLREYDSYGK